MKVIIKRAVSKDKDEDVFVHLVNALVELSRHDLGRLNLIKKDEFLFKTNSESFLSDFKFEDIKAEALNVIQSLGMANPEELTLEDGKYLIVSDSHGKHTKTKMFELLISLNKKMKFDKVIHLGHILDDDNTISYWWNEFENLIVLARKEEIERIQSVKESHKYQIVREKIYIGDVVVSNQEHITDYVKTPITNLDSYKYKENTIVNLHRLEFGNRGGYNNSRFIASPGCLCENHIVKTIKQIDFADGYQVKETRSFGFSKYRKMAEMYDFWEQGLIILNVKDGEVSVVPCYINKIGGDYAISYFDKIYVGKRICKPHKKVFVNADVHCSAQDEAIIDLQEKIIKDYKPDIYVNLGDFLSNEPLNHHDMAKGNVITANYLDEYLVFFNLVNRLNKWADKIYFIRGNHERFMVDFYRKFPQLQSILEKLFNEPFERFNWNVIDHKEVLDIDNVKFIHGDLRLYGQSGKNVDKIAKTFGRNTLMGHSHSTASRFGCQVIGLTGLMNQNYNDVTGSNWNHGFALINFYNKIPFISNIAVYNYTFIGDEVYRGVEKEAVIKDIKIDLE